MRHLSILQFLDNPLSPEGSGRFDRIIDRVWLIQNATGKTEASNRKPTLGYEYAD
jgi:hypothetical protein